MQCRRENFMLRRKLLSSENHYLCKENEDIMFIWKGTDERTKNEREVILII